MTTLREIRFGGDPHANYCGNPIDSRASIGGMSDVSCTAEMVETVDGRWLCPDCDADEVGGMTCCESCGLWFETVPGHDYCDGCFQ